MKLPALNSTNATNPPLQDPVHLELIPLVESALAVMRLSCEKFFVLVSMFAAYLTFRNPPKLARALIKLNARISTAFQKVILYSFPAICWIYSAGEPRMFQGNALAAKRDFCVMQDANYLPLLR